MKQSTKNLLIKLNKDIFAISAASFAVFFFIEQIKPKFVIAYLNINYILLICLISGIVAVLSDEPAEVEKVEERVGPGVLIILSVIVFAVIMVFLRDIGGWGILVSLAGGVVAFLLGAVLVNE